MEKYNNKKNIRFDLFKKTLELALKRNFKTICRNRDFERKKQVFSFFKIKLERWYEYINFSEFANLVQGELHTCDISKKIWRMQRILQKNLRKILNFT